MDIYIMTRGRVGKQFTLQSIPEKWRERTYLVVPEAEEDSHGSAQTIAVPAYVDNYSKKFKYIIDHLTGAKEKYVIMDDDLFFSRRIQGTERLEKITLETEVGASHLNEMFELIEWHLDKVPLVGVHPRQMGHCQPLPYVENSKVICIQAINNALLPDNATDELDVFPILADVVLNCTLLSQGYKNRLITTHLQDHGSCQAPGGCSLYRTPAMQKAAVEWVAERFAPFAKAVTKRPKSAKWMGDERTDLTVQWKKMYAHGQSKRAV